MTAEAPGGSHGLDHEAIGLPPGRMAQCRVRLETAHPPQDLQGLEPHRERRAHLSGHRRQLRRGHRCQVLPRVPCHGVGICTQYLAHLAEKALRVQVRHASSLLLWRHPAPDHRSAAR